MILALIPAHNEEDHISATLQALKAQSRPPDRIVVVTDNCTDQTAYIASCRGGEIFETVDNHSKKAGALNQALEKLLPTLGNHDYVFVQDADSQLDHDFLEQAEKHLDNDIKLAGCGGTFRGGPGGGFVGMLQRNEYARYERDVRRMRGKVLVLTGTASMFRASSLKAVRRARGRVLPPSPGVYDETVLTEDNELSQALLHMGWKIRSPKGCTLVTEVMPTWRDLYAQRVRWKRGATENLLQYGVTSVTLRYWCRQFVTAFGCLVTAAYLATLVVGLFVGFHLQPIWLAVTGIFALERAITVRSRGWKQILVGLSIVIEMGFDVFLQATHLVAYTHTLTKKKRSW